MKKMLVAGIATAFLLLAPTVAHALDESVTSDATVVEAQESTQESTPEDTSADDSTGSDESTIETTPEETASEDAASDEAVESEPTPEAPEQASQPEPVPDVPEEVTDEDAPSNSTTKSDVIEDEPILNGDDLLSPTMYGTDEVIWLDGEWEGCFQQYDMIICPEDNQPELPDYGDDEVVWLEGDFEGCFQWYDMVMCSEVSAPEEESWPQPGCPEPLVEENGNCVEAPQQVVPVTQVAEAEPVPVAVAAQPEQLAVTGDSSVTAVAGIGIPLLAAGALLLTGRRWHSKKAD